MFDGQRKLALLNICCEIVVNVKNILMAIAADCVIGTRPQVKIKIPFSFKDGLLCSGPF